MDCRELFENSVLFLSLIFLFIMIILQKLTIPCEKELQTLNSIRGVEGVLCMEAFFVPQPTLGFHKCSSYTKQKGNEKSLKNNIKLVLRFTFDK